MSEEQQPPAAEGRLTVTTRPPIELFRVATDVASVCKEIVTKTAVNIRGKNHVKVEGWEAIAAAHGCHAGADSADRAYDNSGNHIGYTARGYVRNGNGVIIATGDGFVGFDEADRHGKFTWKERDEYAGRAMAQTRAISRACRSVFAHVVVLIDTNLSTTPAEEMPRDEPEQHKHDRTGRRTELKTDSATREIEIEALKKFLAEHQIPEAFLIKLCVAGNLADGTEEFITDLKDGVIKRLRTDKLRDAILDRWKKSGTPSATEGLSTPPAEQKVEPLPPQPEPTHVYAEGYTFKRPMKIDGKLSPAQIMNFGQVDSWKDVIVPSGTNKDIALGDLTPKQRQYYITKWQPPKASEDGGYDDVDMLFDAALTLAAEEA